MLKIKTKVAKLRVPRYKKSKGKLVMGDTAVILPHDMWAELSGRPGAIAEILEPRLSELL